MDNKLSNIINVNLKNLLLQLNNLTNDEKDKNNDLPNSKYKDQEYFSTLNNNTKSKCLSMLHLNVSSLQKHFDNFECILDEIKLEFDFIGITESRISKIQSPSNNIILPNYSIEHTPTEATAGDALLYIHKKLLTKFALS